MKDVRPLVVAVAGDPGGARAVAPVLEELRAAGRVRVQALAYRQALALWTQRGIACEPLAEDLTAAAIGALLREARPALLLTATSANKVDLEKLFIEQARLLAVPSLTVKDFWSNYAMRFSDAAGRLCYVPDRIAVMDELARTEMIAAGFAPECLVVTGQPAFDDLAACRAAFGPDQRREIRAGLPLEADELFVLFASQPFAEVYGSAENSVAQLGYHEALVLGALREALAQLVRQHDRRVTLVIRPHPREQAEAFAAPADAGFRTLVSTGGDSRQFVMAADLVVGMTTVLLVEACYLGCPVVSLQPGLRQPDCLPTNRSGLSRPAYTLAAIAPLLEEMLFDPAARATARARLAHLAHEGGATRRVADLVYSMLECPAAKECTT